MLEATVNFPFRYDQKLVERSRYWGKELRHRFNARVEKFFPKDDIFLPYCYIFARTVPCPDTGFDTPLIPDWHLLKPKGSSYRLVAEPIIKKKNGTWTVRIAEIGARSNQIRQAPAPTYSDGKGISLFTNLQIPSEYIKAKAQQGEMRSALYAVVVKKPQGLVFEPPKQVDLAGLRAAKMEMSEHRFAWEQNGSVPTEAYPEVTSDERPRLYGMPMWADMFSPRQLLCMSVLVEELRKMEPNVIATEGKDIGAAIIHLCSFVIDKFANYNSYLSSWKSDQAGMRSVFDRHDFSFKPTWAEMAPCGANVGLDWAIENVCGAYEALSNLPRAEDARPVSVSLGTATNLPEIADESISAVVVDPPYTDNVQYSELADFFYVWLKRTQGHSRPEWFSSYLCEHTEEAVVNVSRHRHDDEPVKIAKAKANEFYKTLMRNTFKECRRILRDDGALTVMFTHKKQEAWEALFTSLVQAGFTITATWPVKTESEHSLHQAKKNAAQSTVILIARKRDDDAEVGYFDEEMKREIRHTARKAAERLQKEGLNPVDQLVGSFGPAMEVYSRYAEVRTDTGDAVGVDRALDEASDAVTAFRIQQLSERGLQDVEPEGRFYLLCWDVLRAAEFRFNEAKLLGHAVGMDVDTLVVAGLVSKSGDKIKILSAKDRRRSKKLEREEIEETLFGAMPTGKKKRINKGDVLKVHPNDAHFRTALDACHAMALRYVEAGGGNPGIGSARQLATQQGWKGGSPVARLIEALLKAAPRALWHDKGKTSAAALYPEFRAWHAMVGPLFGINPPEWAEAEDADLELPLEYKEVSDDEIEAAEEEDDE